MARTAPAIRCPSAEIAGRGAAGVTVPAGREDAEYEVEGVEGGRANTEPEVIVGAGAGAESTSDREPS